MSNITIDFTNSQRVIQRHTQRLQTQYDTASEAQQHSHSRMLQIRLGTFRLRSFLLYLDRHQSHLIQMFTSAFWKLKESSLPAACCHFLAAEHYSFRAVYCYLLLCHQRQERLTPAVGGILQTNLYILAKSCFPKQVFHSTWAYAK